MPSSCGRDGQRDHLVEGHHADDELSVQFQSRVTHGRAQQADLHIALMSERIADQDSRARSVPDQSAGDDHRALGGVVVAEAPGIMHDPGEQAIRGARAHLRRIHQLVKQ